MKELKPGTYEIRQAYYDEYRHMNFYNAPELLVIDGRAIVIRSGRMDNVTIFQAGAEYLVLSTSEKLDYAGLDTFNRSEMASLELMEKSGDFDLLNAIDATGIYIENISDEYRDFFDQAELDQAELLSNYLP